MEEFNEEDELEEELDEVEVQKEQEVQEPKSNLQKAADVAQGVAKAEIKRRAISLVKKKLIALFVSLGGVKLLLAVIAALAAVIVVVAIFGASTDISSHIANYLPGEEYFDNTLVDESYESEYIRKRVSEIENQKNVRVDALFIAAMIGEIPGLGDAEELADFDDEFDEGFESDSEMSTNLSKRQVRRFVNMLIDAQIKEETRKFCREEIIEKPIVEEDKVIEGGRDFTIEMYSVFPNLFNILTSTNNEKEYRYFEIQNDSECNGKIETVVEYSLKSQEEVTEFLKNDYFQARYNKRFDSMSEIDKETALIYFDLAFNMYDELTGSFGDSGDGFNTPRSLGLSGLRLTTSEAIPEDILSYLTIPLPADRCRQSACYGYYGSSNCRIHAGIDFGLQPRNVTPGPEIYAVYDGEVVQVVSGGRHCEPNRAVQNWCGHCASQGRRANILTLKHTILGNDYYSTYVHLDSFAKVYNLGDRVQKGEVIGIMGNTGCSTGAHLHFEFGRYNGEGKERILMDPTNLFRTNSSCTILGNCAEALRICSRR